MDNISKGTKINHLISNWPRGTLKTVSELERLGFTPQLLKVYANSNWIELVGRGVYKLYNDEVGWQGALFALQRKSEKTRIHAGAKTALTLRGYGHYLRQHENKVYLFSNRNENTHVWLKKFEQVVQTKTEVFDYSKEDYITLFNNGNFYIGISSTELAAMEMLYLIPREQSFDEAIKIMEGLVTLRPKLVQQLLEECKSIKVKRLFLFMAERNDLPCFKELDFVRINLGSGKRSIVQNGVLDKTHNITVPREYGG